MLVIFLLEKLCKNYHTPLNGHENVLQVNPKNFAFVPFFGFID